ncbi:universal stress protein [Inmirania thermothiophila]|uniref:Nucleotide-binding universal stress UspA family protein n=1 Tax=Inmirania thermothiophila TaxID=1750597 RepID=A0A3N1YBZ5_9GAMM|nr:universal stress protein [Inmirania thermothiophila]ROR35212.1 nucleotide-binding universal stress UspA family protein [Inmirania thermothiophila]
MAIRDILVHLDPTPRCRARLELALALASAHGARVVGLYAVAAPYVPDFVPGVAPEQLREADRAKAAEAERAFREAAGRAGVEHEWRGPDGRPLGLADVIDEVVVHARHADLAIVGQHDDDDALGLVPADLPDQVLLDAGRPVLVVPYAGQFRSVGERVMVAWNASREATRAVHDALPLLRAAKKVVVLAVNPGEAPGAGHGEIPGADISAHLARHGVKAEAEHVHADDIQVGDMLLSRAADEGVDLIVCGGYGQPRLREVVLGGVTRHLLKQMTVPVLFSH